MTRTAHSRDRQAPADGEWASALANVRPCFAEQAHPDHAELECAALVTRYSERVRNIFWFYANGLRGPVLPPASATCSDPRSECPKTPHRVPKGQQGCCGRCFPATAHTAALWPQGTSRFHCALQAPAWADTAAIVARAWESGDGVIECGSTISFGALWRLLRECGVTDAYLSAASVNRKVQAMYDQHERQLEAEVAVHHVKLAAMHRSLEQLRCDKAEAAKQATTSLMAQKRDEDLADEARLASTPLRCAVLCMRLSTRPQLSLLEQQIASLEQTIA